MVMDEIIESKLTLMQYIDKTPKTTMNFNNDDVINASDDFLGLRTSLTPVVSQVENVIDFDLVVLQFPSDKSRVKLK